eukprot:1589678-Lingulodinium_polyedra.AAC.1
MPDVHAPRATAVQMPCTRAHCRQARAPLSRHIRAGVSSHANTTMQHFRRPQPEDLTVTA